MTEARRSQSKPTRPDFRNPPVTEVVLGVTFRELPNFTAAHAGDLWRLRWREAFPRAEQHNPYATPIERFGLPPRAQTIALEVTEQPGVRLWFIADDDRNVIQIQRDWFACNWRKRGDAEYDRWPARRRWFETYVQEFASYLAEQGIGSLEPTQCEVTYVNHIDSKGGVWSAHSELSKVVRLAGTFGVPSVVELEHTQVGATFLFPPGKEQTMGRLHVTAQPAALKEDNSPIFVLNLTARGRPRTADIPGVLEFLDRGRDCIVHTFAEITTPEMHKVWGRNA